jgi:hypothetical protein
MREGVPQGSSVVPFCHRYLQNRLPKGVHSSLFTDDSALWVHTPRLENAVPVLQEGVREVHRWRWVKKLTLNLEKSKVSFFPTDPHETKWQPVVEVEGTILRFNPTTFCLRCGARQDIVREGAG